MRKRTLAWIFALLLAPALARAEKVTVAQLHEQAEAMGRWTKTYEAHGRTIDVDIPVIVPDVDAFPVVTVEHAAPLTPELLAEVEATAKRVNDAYALTPTEGAHAGDRVELTFITPGARDEYAPQAGARLSVACNQRDVVPGIGLNEVQAEHWTYAWAREDGVAYAEDNPLTYGEAKSIAERVFAAAYPQTGGGMTVRMASHIDRPRQNGSDEPVRGAPMGKYLLACSQTFEGIPVLSTPGFRFEPGDSLRFASGGDVFGAFYVHVASANAFYLLTSHSLLRQREIAHADVPLASLQEVMAVVEERILAGHICEVYALELGYFPFADARDGDVAWLYPTWVLSCAYVEDANAEENVREVKTDGDMPAYMTSTYQEVLLPAQRLEVLPGDWRAAEAKKGSGGFLCPRVDE